MLLLGNASENIDYKKGKHQQSDVQMLSVF